jgi:hypothetical protein
MFGYRNFIASFFLSFLYAGGLAPVYAQSETTQTMPLERLLNSVKDVAGRASDAELEDSCRELNEVLQTQQGSFLQQQAWQHAWSYAQQVYGEHCEGLRLRDVSTGEAILWDGSPQCEPSRSIKACRYSQKSGRGTFIVRGPDVQGYPNYLVCAMTTGRSRNVLGYDYMIDSRCVASDLDWEGFLMRKVELQQRSDAQGFYHWMNGDGARAAVELPAALAVQCATAFPEAQLCAPFLIVLPSDEAGQVDVCSLRTYNTGLGLLFIKVDSKSSQWSCQRHDLGVGLPRDPQLSRVENYCIPNWRGQVPPECDLPYIPRSRLKEQVNHYYNPR